MHGRLLTSMTLLSLEIHSTLMTSPEATMPTLLPLPARIKSAMLAVLLRQQEDQAHPHQVHRHSRSRGRCGRSGYQIILAWCL